MLSFSLSVFDASSEASELLSVVLVCCEGLNIEEGIADCVITLPKTDEILMPTVAAVPLQLIAYYTSVLKGCDVDKPRNLAKSVTVE